MVDVDDTIDLDEDEEHTGDEDKNEDEDEDDREGVRRLNEFDDGSLSDGDIPEEDL